MTPIRSAFPACRQEWALAVDPYTTLGVKKDATQDDIQKAYRRLAKKLHPDLNPGDKIAEDKFKEVSVAYDLLGDPEKRARFDRGEIDASGNGAAAPAILQGLCRSERLVGLHQQCGLFRFRRIRRKRRYSLGDFRPYRPCKPPGAARMFAIISSCLFLMPSMAASSLLSFLTAPRWTSISHRGYATVRFCV